MLSLPNNKDDMLSVTYAAFSEHSQCPIWKKRTSLVRKYLRLYFLAMFKVHFLQDMLWDNQDVATVV